MKHSEVFTCTAIVLAGGSGKRMNSTVRKQYLTLGNRPVLSWSLTAFQECPFIRDIVLVTGQEDKEVCRREIVEKYGITKIHAIVSGGRERYDSVYAGLCSCDAPSYVFIHDSARPLLTQDMLERLMDGVQKYDACSLGMPVKDTINLVNKQGAVLDTPARDRLWIVQTPQAFPFELILQAHIRLRESGQIHGVTDDLMVVRKVFGTEAHMIPGSYRNIKITTPEDLPVAEILLQELATAHR